MTMMSKTFAAACLGAALTALPAATGAVQAMPLHGAQPAIAHAAGPAAQIDRVRWVCGPYRCHWAPNYYYGWRRPYWGPRPYWGYRHYGWGRHWRY